MMHRICTADARPKRLALLAFATLLFAILALPQSAFAVPSTGEIYVGDSGKSLYQLQQSGSAPSGLSYNSSTGVLTLNGYNGGPIYVKSDNSRDLIVDVKGTNYIKATGTAHNGRNTALECWSDISYNYCSLTIRGTGKLNIHTVQYSNTQTIHAGIACGGDITIAGSVEVVVSPTALTTSASSSSGLYGIYTSAGNVYIKDTAQVTVQCSTKVDQRGAAVRLPSSGGKKVFITSSNIIDFDCRDAGENSGSLIYYGIEGGSTPPLSIQNAQLVYIRGAKPFTGYDTSARNISGYWCEYTSSSGVMTLLLYHKCIPLTPDMLKSAPPTAVYTGASQQWRGMSLLYYDHEIPDVTNGGESGFVRSYSGDTTNVGTVTITFTGKGLYSGSFSKTYQIVPRNIYNFTMEGLKDTYPLGPGGVQPHPTIKSLGGTVLKEGKDYTLTWENNTFEPSSNARVIAHGIGNYTGTLAGTFAIQGHVEVPVVTLAGNYANETAAEIAEEAFFESDWVIIARDDDFADALGATGLAGALNAPILLTDRNGLSDDAAFECLRLESKYAYIIGGTGAISTQVDEDLESFGVEVKGRIWGENSYDTSLACAREIEKVTSSHYNTAIIAMSTNFQDALSISPYAYKNKLPVILQTWGATSAERGFTDEARAWLSDRHLIVVGGEGAISNASLATPSGCTVLWRLWGETGYDTSQKIADFMVNNHYLSADNAVIACGAQAPKGVDALAGAALAGRLNCPILLVNGNEELEAVDFTTIDGYLESHADMSGTVYVLGGSYVMPQSVYDAIEMALEPKG